VWSCLLRSSPACLLKGPLRRPVNVFVIRRRGEETKKIASIFQAEEKDCQLKSSVVGICILAGDEQIIAQAVGGRKETAGVDSNGRAGSARFS